MELRRLGPLVQRVSYSGPKQFGANYNASPNGENYRGERNRPHVNLRTFVRAVLQYTDITRDPALYTFPTPAQTRRLFSQYLFSYKLNPQTVFRMGYSGNASGTQAIDLTRTDRTFFMKIGYTWVR